MRFKRIENLLEKLKIKDWLDAQHDYEINLKAELEIADSLRRL